MQVVAADVAFKHEQMATTPFAFLRATFYRWAQQWPRSCAELARAPQVLAAGDVHIENFGTWRDSEGRLVWGVNDFDEAYPLSYANDLVRLATSARLAIAVGTLSLTPRRACDAVLEGYRDALRTSGRAFVLEEKHPVLRGEAESALRDPAVFWHRIEGLPRLAAPPLAATQRLSRALPRGVQPVHLARRAGLGSLGHPRVVALALWHGGRLAREAKALAPSACVWASGGGGRPALLYDRVLRGAVRSPDPYLWADGPWVVRRLAPDCSRIEFTTVKTRTGQEDLLGAMGSEIANVHLGSGPLRARAVLRDLSRRDAGWLHAGSRVMEAATRKDFDAWRRAARGATRARAARSASA